MNSRQQQLFGDMDTFTSQQTGKAGLWSAPAARVVLGGAGERSLAGVPVVSGRSKAVPCGLGPCFCGDGETTGAVLQIATVPQPPGRRRPPSRARQVLKHCYLHASLLEDSILEATASKTI